MQRCHTFPFAHYDATNVVLQVIVYNIVQWVGWMVVENTHVLPNSSNLSACMLKSALVLLNDLRRIANDRWKSNGASRWTLLLYRHDLSSPGQLRFAWNKEIVANDLSMFNPTVITNEIIFRSKSVYWMYVCCCPRLVLRLPSFFRFFWVTSAGDWA